MPATNERLRRYAMAALRLGKLKCPGIIALAALYGGCVESPSLPMCDGGLAGETSPPVACQWMATAVAFDCDGGLPKNGTWAGWDLKNSYATGSVAICARHLPNCKVVSNVVCAGVVDVCVSQILDAGTCSAADEMVCPGTLCFEDRG
jgi:hypothetical protein